MSKIAVVMLLAALVTGAALSSACADYYQYTGSGGTVTITNKLDAVPKKYRATMKVTRETDSKKQEPQVPSASVQEETVTPQTAAPAPAAAPEGRFAQLSARFVWFKPLVLVALVLAVFVALTKVTALIPSPLLAKLIYLGFFAGVFVFLYKAYTEHVVRSSLEVKEKAVTVFKKSMAREAAQEGEPVAPGQAGK